MKEDKSRKKQREKRHIASVWLLVILCIAGAAVWFLNMTPEDTPSRKLSSGLLPGSSEKDYSEAEEEYIRIQINSRPVFEDGSSEGNLYIGNPDTNGYEMEVAISLEAPSGMVDQKVVYNSGRIPPGYYIDNDQLDVALEAGEYPALAEITYYKEDGMIQNQTNVKLTIIINN